MKWCSWCRIIINVKRWWQRHVHWGFPKEFFFNKCPFTLARREIEIACMEQRESLWRVDQCLMTNAPPCHQKHLTKRQAGHGGNGRRVQEAGWHGRAYRQGRWCRLPEDGSADRRVGRWAEKAAGGFPPLPCLTASQSALQTHQGKTFAIL